MTSLPHSYLAIYSVSSYFLCKYLCFLSLSLLRFSFYFLFLFHSTLNLVTSFSSFQFSNHSFLNQLSSLRPFLPFIRIIVLLFSLSSITKTSCSLLIWLLFRLGIIINHLPNLPSFFLFLLHSFSQCNFITSCCNFNFPFLSLNFSVFLPILHIPLFLLSSPLRTLSSSSPTPPLHHHPPSSS